MDSDNIECFRNSYVVRTIIDYDKDAEPKCVRIEIPNFRISANYGALPNEIFKEYLDAIMGIRVAVNSLHFLATKNLINGDVCNSIYEKIRQDILPELVAKLDILVFDAKHNSQFKCVPEWSAERDWKMAYEYALDLYTEMTKHEMF